MTSRPFGSCLYDLIDAVVWLIDPANPSSPRDRSTVTVSEYRTTRPKLADWLCVDPSPVQYVTGDDS